MKCFVAICLLLTCGFAHATVDLPLFFSDGMVLQRDRPIPVWGMADAGSRVRVEFDGNAIEAVADGSGRWRLMLPAHAAGGPYRMRIIGADASRELHDILIGDVWLASGQSNMEWTLSRAANAATEVARADDPKIRHFKIPHAWSGQRQWQLEGGSWVASSPETAGEFSAVAHLFAREIRATTGVPIGIIDSSWGGSRIEAWMDAQTLGIDPVQVARDVERMRAEEEAALSETRHRLAFWKTMPANDAGWQAEHLDERDWVSIAVPMLWEQAGWTGLDGVAWYRTTFELDEAQAKRGLRLSLGRIDDSDDTWVNGIAVGAMRNQWNTPRSYEVPARALHAGRNSLAVRVIDGGGGGGIHGPPEDVCVQSDDRACVPLPREWRFRVADAVFSTVDGKQHKPTLLYNRMIAPLRDMPLRGVVWYQGEANADNAEDALRYRQQFVAMIRQWRRQWASPELPFLWVQLANFRSGFDTSTQSPWALLRESQSVALALPSTAQAVTIDIGTPGDIHPANKQDVAHRLALAARHLAYGESLVYSPPVFKSVDFVGNEAHVRFDHGAALAVRGGGDRVGGFALAGADRVFHPAQANLQGDIVVASSPQVAKPQAVRYGWRDDPEDADLIGREQLPVSPFRSDAW
ncbi:MAG: 9-O-acetylesterase [Lysobacter sp.]|nr:9-O-acetylesterase [Lysobacter sp.]